MTYPPLPEGFTLDSVPPLPDGFTLDAKPKKSLKEQFPAEYDSSSPQFKAKYGATSGGAFENFGAGAGKFFNDIKLGVGQRLGLVDESEIQQDREVSRELMGTKAGKLGYLGAGVGATAPLLAIPGVNSIAGAGAVGALTGAAQPTVGDESVIKNAALSGAFGAAGQGVGTLVGKGIDKLVSSRVAKGAADEAAASVRDATLKESIGLGYKVPPSHVNPTVKNRFVESLSGKAQTQQSMTVNNQKVTNRLIRQEFGLSPSAPLTRETFKNIRTVAGSAYKAVKETGEIVTDDQYLNDLISLTKSADEVAKDFPDYNVASSTEIQALQKSLTQEKFSANGAIEMLKQLRDDAKGNLAWNVEDPAKKALGLAQREAAGLLEDQVVRHLNKIGKGKLATQFDKARVTIAKAHSAEQALNPATGNIVASKLSAQLRRNKPLSGNFEKVAKFGASFPKVAGEQLSSPGVSALDPLLGAVGAGSFLGDQDSALSGLLAVPLLRMGARGAIGSKFYQGRNVLPRYTPPMRLSRGLGAISPYTPSASVVLPAYLQQQETL